MEIIAPSIKYIDFQGYVYSEASSMSHLLQELYVYIISELQKQR